MDLEAGQTVTCYRHLDRVAGVRCQRCERPICPSCMISASVGFHCPECAHGQRQQVMTIRSLQTRPVMTFTLMAINVAVFFAGVLTSGGELMGTGGGFDRDGGLAAVFVRHGDWWRIISAGFLHANLLHLGFNMFALYYLGTILEHVMGRLRFVVLYFTALVAGSFGVLLVSPNTLTVGASGAIFGLMGAALAGQRSQGIRPWESGIGSLLGINLLFTFLLPGISIGGHLGGLAGGLVAGWILFDGSRHFRSPNVAIAACGALTVALGWAALWVAANPIF